MAMIIPKRRKKGTVYYIVQTLLDENGKRKQHWIPCESARDAKLLLTEVEDAESRNEQYDLPDIFKDLRTGMAVRVPTVPETDLTVERLVKDYIEHHSKVGYWEAATRSGVESVAAHYIYPFIGHWKIASVKARNIQEYYKMLLTQRTARVSKNTGSEFVSPLTVREVHKILRPAFSYAVKQGYLESNPTIETELPRIEKFEREQWTEAEVQHAFRVCKDPELLLMMKVMFCCCLRTGELLGITVDALHLHPHSDNRPYLEVKQELARLKTEHIEQTKTTIYKVFPPLGPGQKTSMVLKKPKTKSSVRKIYLPRSLAKELDQYCTKRHAVLKENGYPDYGMVFFLDNGRPISGDVIVKRFKAFIKENNLRPVDLYSLRHSSATFKLRKSGDIKAVQGDMGHTDSTMLLNTYAAIADEARQKLADETELMLLKLTLDENEDDGQQTTEKTSGNDTDSTD